MIGNYLLRGKMKCGYCGSTINGESGTSRTGKTCYYYKCASRKRRQPCQKQTVRKEEIEDLVMTVIKQLFSDRHLQVNYAEGILASYKAECCDRTVLNLLVKELETVNTSIGNLLQALEAGIITGSTKQRLEELEIQKTDLEVKIEKEKNGKTPRLTERDILSFFQTILDLSARQLIQLLVKEIVLYDDRMVITFYHTNDGQPSDEARNILVSEQIVAFHGGTNDDKIGEKPLVVTTRF